MELGESGYSFKGLPMLPIPLFCETAALCPRAEKQPRLVDSSRSSMENQLIAVIVRFPSALPTTKSRDPGGHLSVYHDLLYHPALRLRSYVLTFSPKNTRVTFNSPLTLLRVFSSSFFKHLLTRNGTGGHSSVDFSI